MRFLSHETWADAEDCQCRRCIGRITILASSRTHTHGLAILDQPQFQYMLISLDFNKNSDLNKLKAPEQTKLSSAINARKIKGSWEEDSFISII